MTDKETTKKAEEFDSTLSKLTEMCKARLELFTKRSEEVEESLKKYQETVTSQFAEISPLTQFDKLFPSFSEYVSICRKRVSDKHLLKTNEKIEKINKMIKIITSNIENIEKIRAETHEKLNSINKKTGEKVEKQTSDEETPFLIETMNEIVETKRNCSFLASERNKKENDKLHKMLVDERKICDECSKAEERIKKLSSSCKNLSKLMPRCMKNKGEHKTRRMNCSICSFPIEEVNIQPTKRKNQVEIGNLIVLAPVRSLTRRQKLLEF